MELSLFCTRIIFLVLLITLCSPLQRPIDIGPLKFLQATNSSSTDFGKMIFNSPSAVLRPNSTKEISLLLNFVSSSSSFSKTTVAARGAGHSIQGQAQALNGIVIEMDSLSPHIKIHRNGDGLPGFSYADASGWTLWVELLKESLKEGLAPRSWTDYLYLSIGGTLSNGGISGQTFKYGPQISNVLQLDVITGTGELVTCSPTNSSELFYAVLGGLGQFGVITSARILLQDAPQKVKWVRAFYDDFEIFIKDQELLVSMPNMVDYLEGFLVLNEKSLHSSSVAFPLNLGFISQLKENSSDIYYCIEFAVYYHLGKKSNVDEVVEEISKQLSHINSHIYSVEVSYFDFLNRVRTEEMSLRSEGLWDIPHPWLNLFVPSSGIKRFKDLLLDHISPNLFEGPILIYPFLSDKWNTNMSAVLPDEHVVYSVGVLRAAHPKICSIECLGNILQQNRKIAETAMGSEIGAKYYLASYNQESQWQKHFGRKWERFVARKLDFDPLGVLAPGQRIFKRK